MPVVPCLALLLVVVAGCMRHAPTPESTDTAPKVARSSVERGPVRLTVTVDPSPARLSDEPTLTVEIDHAEGVKVQKPEFGEALGEFILRDFREPMPRVKDDRQIIQQIYTIEPTWAGKIVIDPIAVRFIDDRPEGGGKESTLETEPITVEVAAAVADEAPSLAALRPAAEPVLLPRPSVPAAWWIAGLLVLALAAAGAAWWHLRRRKLDRAGPPLTPTQLAYLELQRLLENLEARGDVKVFYVELTAIVRRYIERTTGVRAPEQTTQEFLHEISRRADFPEQESRRLKSFLEAADLVKFAAYQPRPEDVEESVRRAKAFVGCTEHAEAAA
jgi:hypothetical protein